MAAGSEDSRPQNHPGLTELICLTNEQFDFWNKILVEVTGEKFKANNDIHYWFILSALALRPDFSMNKKECFQSIPNLSTESVRKHVAAASKLGLVETVKTKGVITVRLTSAGQHAVFSTMERWIQEFGKIQALHFAAL